MKKYQVIGGQYNKIIYGESDSLHGAKCIATKHDEFWDSWGWERPRIYYGYTPTSRETPGRLAAKYNRQTKRWENYEG